MSNNYIDPKIIKKLSKAKGEFNFKKLTMLLEELNDNYKRKNIYSCTMIIRTVLDHTPPLLGFSNFIEVVDSYPWGKTDKAIMKSLLDFKLDAHDILHRPISNKYIPIKFIDLPKPRRLYILLNECVEKWKEKGKLIPKKTIRKEPKIDVSIKEKQVIWAHYAVGRYVWSSFKVVLFINNFRSIRGDYVKVALKADSRDLGDVWEAKHFIFELPREPDKSSPNKDFEIGAGKKIDVQVFISDVEVGNREKRNMPDFDRDRLCLNIETESEMRIKRKIKPGWIMQG